MSDDLVKRMIDRAHDAGRMADVSDLGKVRDRIEALEAALLMVRARYPMVRSDENAVNRALEGSHD
jgi:hypothetical protein